MIRRKMLRRGKVEYCDGSDDYYVFEVSVLFYKVLVSSLDSRRHVRMRARSLLYLLVISF